jgi:hypothetical protein
VTETDLGSNAAQQNNGREAPGADGAGEREVLAKLPRTRPQRASPRRAAARAASARRASPQATAPTAPPSPLRKAKRATTRPAASKPAAAEAEVRASTGEPRDSAPRPKRSAPKLQARAKRATARGRVAAPRQGFECDGEAGESVQPPGGVELVASAAEIVGELTKAGLSRSERLLKDIISRLPLS